MVGYCQGMNLLAAALLLVLEEEDAFWVFATVIERILPPNYYTSNLLISQADQRCVPSTLTRPRLLAQGLMARPRRRGRRARACAPPPAC